MIEIPKIWTSCKISALSKRTKELVIAVLREARFDVIPDENSVKITPQKESLIVSFRHVIDALSATVSEENVEFTVADE